jgi:hypothetical protein
MLRLHLAELSVGKWKMMNLSEAMLGMTESISHAPIAISLG